MFKANGGRSAFFFCGVYCTMADTKKGIFLILCLFWSSHRIHLKSHPQSVQQLQSSPPTSQYFHWQTNIQPGHSQEGNRNVRADIAEDENNAKCN